jgi:predicted DNA-binding transcriptional regulator YafY
VTDTAARQLQRILLLIPHLADGEEHALTDLAAAVGTDRETVVRDLRAIVERAAEPGGFVGGVQLYLSADSVSLVTKTFLRPMRLTRGELAAIDAGLLGVEARTRGAAGDAVRSARRRLRQLALDGAGVA